MDKDKLLTSPEDRIRGWLCDVYIARGENDAARLEGELDRRIQGSVIPQLLRHNKKNIWICAGCA